MPPTRELQTSDGYLRIDVLAPRLIATKVKGRFGEALLPTFLATFEEWASGASSLVSFHDWEEMTDYDLRARVELTQWTFRHRAQLAEIHFLLRSSVVRIGVEIANFALGRFMRTHANRAEFERALSVAKAAAMGAKI